MTALQPGSRDVEHGSHEHFECRDLHAYYGDSHILRGVSLSVRHGETLALLGRNGAGKTTTLRTIARAEPPIMRRGEIWLRGTPIHTLPTHRAAREGIALVPEDRRIVAGLTVEENLRLAQVAPGRGWSLDRIYERFPRLAERRRQDGTTLSGGEQQMLAIARALGRDLSLLLLDEPYEGLAPHIVQEIETIMAALKHDGLTVLLVEQNAVAALRIADRVAILDDGRVVFDGAPSDVLGDDGLRRALLAV
ncbi:ABC transporter ATP-binding protein [Desertimonas flava]|uniref:ABC transporter ATP-binding protein n=1 Tax=Desertimonas flava TaxID=2064846 RepID=UPI001877B0EC|nr:ABC transporter ATP-binding protein [Desertimonas flava]